MALVRCRVCQTRRVVGFMPTSSCGFLLFPPLILAVLSTTLTWDVWGAWSLLLPVPVFVLGAWVAQIVPLAIEYLWVCRRACPRCGSRRWTFPFTEGFGL